MTHDDPKLTAYALGELDDDPAARAEVEALLASDDAARRIVDETRHTAVALTRDFQTLPAPTLSPRQRQALTRTGRALPLRQNVWSRRALAAAACAAVAFAGVQLLRDRDPAATLTSTTTDPSSLSSHSIFGANAAAAAAAAALEKNDLPALAKIARENPDPVVALPTVAVLASVGGAEPAREFLTDRRTEYRSAAVAGLGSGGNPDVIPALEEAAKDDDRGVRLTALQALNNIDDFRIFEPMILMLYDPDTRVRRVAHHSIEARIGLLFPDYHADDPGDQRAAAADRIKAQVAMMKPAFERRIAFEKQTRSAPGGN
jgi:anti-sigma factor RsiW